MKSGLDDISLYCISLGIAPKHEARTLHLLTHDSHDVRYMSTAAGLFLGGNAGIGFYIGVITMLLANDLDEGRR